MMTYEYDPDANIIHLHGSGILVRDDPINYFRELNEREDLKPQALEMVYFQALEDIQFSYLDAMAIKTAFSETRHGEKLSGTIFLVDSDFTFGMARMITQALDSQGHNFSIKRV